MQKEKKMRKTHFKFLTFLSGLIDILLGAGTVALGVLLVMAVGGWFEGLTGIEGVIQGFFWGIFIQILTYAALACLFVAFLMCLILGIMMIVSSFRGDQLFERRKGFIKFTIVSDFILAIMVFVLAFALEGIAQIGCIIVGAGLLLSGIMKTVDIQINKNRVVKIEEQVLKEHGQDPNVPQKVDFSALGKPKTENKEEKSAEEIAQQENELQKLEDMKKSGLIDEKEYQQRKNEIKGENK